MDGRGSENSIRFQTAGLHQYLPEPDHEDERESDGQDDSDDASSQNESFNLEEEVTFEKLCVSMLNSSNWVSLEQIARRHLQKNHTSSWKAFFYYGVSMYTQGKFVLAIAAFEKSEKINSNDA